MLPILRPDQIRALDRATIQKEPIASLELMERAARAFGEALMAVLNPGQACWVLAGSGNNGGDALVVARLLHLNGFPVRVLVLRLGAQGSPDFERNLGRAEALKLPIRVLEQGDDADPARVPEAALPDWSEVVVDGLFGAGLNRPPEGMALALIRAVAEGGQPVYAIDVPSGLQADGPPPKGTALPARRTWTFETPKAAFLLPDRGALAGDWSVLPIGLHTPSLAEMDVDAALVQPADLLGVLERRPRFGHKRLFGEVLVAGGGPGMRGAAFLSATAAMRAGAGLATVAHPDPSDAPQVLAGFPEIMLRPEWPEGLTKNTALVLGPGLGQSDTAHAFLEHLLGLVQDAPSTRVLLDADALNALAVGRIRIGPDGAAERHDAWPQTDPDAVLQSLRHLADALDHPPVLTPHPGEYQRLFGPLPEGRAGWDHVRDCARASGCVVVLKGAYTVIASPDPATSGHLRVNHTGHPGMGTAGSGDALAGIIAALLAQGLDAVDAAWIGVGWHGLAATEAARRLAGESGMLAGDLIAALPQTRSEWLEAEQRPLYPKSLNPSKTESPCPEPWWS